MMIRTAQPACNPFHRQALTLVHSRPWFRGKETSMKFNVLLIAFGCLLGSQSIAAAQDAAAGEKVFMKCRACHQVGETAKNAVGPLLNGLMGRKSGTIEGYNYTEANKNSGITWDEASFAEYIKNPKAKIPGTKMIFPGLPKDEEIQDLTAFLKQVARDGKKT
jgi:cytochrome c